MTENHHVAVPEAIRRSFGMEPEALEKMIENYFRGGAIAFHRTHTAGTPSGAI